MHHSSRFPSFPALPVAVVSDVHAALLCVDRAAAAFRLRVAAPTRASLSEKPGRGSTGAATDRPTDALDHAVFAALCKSKPWVSPPSDTAMSDEDGAAPPVLERPWDPTTCISLTEAVPPNDDCRWTLRRQVRAPSNGALPHARQLALSCGGCDDEPVVPCAVLEASAVASCAPRSVATIVITGGDATTVLPFPFAAWPGLQTLDASRSTVTALCDEFGCDCKALSNVVLPPAITATGNCLCEGVYEMVELDLARCPRLTTIGHKVAQWCIALQSITLPPSVVSIGDMFCAHAESLAVLDLAHCTRLTSIGDKFALECTALQRVMLPASVISIGNDCCQECPNLELLTVGDSSASGSSSSSSLVSIGNRFAYRATGLLSLDFSHCARLATIGADFAGYGESLSEVRLPESLEKIGDHFCQSTAIAELDLAHCEGLTRLRHSFASDSALLRRIALPSSVTQIDGHVCCSTMIESLDLSHCAALTRLGNSVARGCDALRRAVLPASVTELGDALCARSRQLQTLDLSACVNLTEIDDEFISDAFIAHRVVLPPDGPARERLVSVLPKSS